MCSSLEDTQISIGVENLCSLLREGLVRGLWDFGELYFSEVKVRNYDYVLWAYVIRCKRYHSEMDRPWLFTLRRGLATRLFEGPLERVL